MILLPLLFSLAFTGSSLAGVPFKDCGSVDGVINSVSVSSCATLPCQFKRNTNISVEIDFTTSADITGATTVVHGIIAGIPVPFPIAADACKDMPCPFKSGVKGVYKNKVFVLPAYPKLRLVVKWEVVDQNKKDLVCFVIPVEITD